MNNLWNQLPNGRRVSPSDVVPIDAIAYLSGVNFGSVLKVLAAINAIELNSSIRLDQLIDLKAIPLESLSVTSKTADGRHRVKETDRLVRAIVKLPSFDSFEPVLSARARLGINVKPD